MHAYSSLVKNTGLLHGKEWRLTCQSYIVGNCQSLDLSSGLLALKILVAHPPPTCPHPHFGYLHKDPSQLDTVCTFIDPHP